MHAVFDASDPRGDKGDSGDGRDHEGFLERRALEDRDANVERFADLDHRLRVFRAILAVDDAIAHLTRCQQEVVNEWRKLCMSGKTPTVSEVARRLGKSQEVCSEHFTNAKRTLGLLLKDHPAIRVYRGLPTS
jgi:hypothetical protein